MLTFLHTTGKGIAKTPSANILEPLTQNCYMDGQIGNPLGPEDDGVLLTPLSWQQTDE
jgi:hypothetical protein